MQSVASICFLVTFVLTTFLSACSSVRALFISGFATIRIQWNIKRPVEERANPKRFEFFTSYLCCTVIPYLIYVFYPKMIFFFMIDSISRYLIFYNRLILVLGLLTLERTLAGVPDLRRKWRDFIGKESLVLLEVSSMAFGVEVTKRPEAEMGGVADLELLELFSQLFSFVCSMILAGDFTSIFGSELQRSYFLNL